MASAAGARALGGIELIRVETDVVRSSIRSIKSASFCRAEKPACMATGTRSPSLSAGVTQGTETMNFTKRQLEAINDEEGNLQLIACAGSGKTEVVGRRVASIRSINPPF